MNSKTKEEKGKTDKDVVVVEEEAVENVGRKGKRTVCVGMRI